MGHVNLLDAWGGVSHISGQFYALMLTDLASVKLNIMAGEGIFKSHRSLNLPKKKPDSQQNDQIAYPYLSRQFQSHPI